MTEIDRRPPPSSVGVAALVGAFATVATTAGSLQGGTVVFAGVLLLGVGLVAASRRVVAWGGGVCVLGVAFAGVSGASGVALVIAAVGVAVAWDVADHALSLGEHVGRRARSRRNQLVHAGTTAVAGTLTAAVAYGAYLAATGGQPVVALVFLLFGAVVLASAFR